MTVTTRRSGFGLPAALLALVVVGALVTGGLYTAMNEDRSSANAQFGNHAYLAAERGLDDLFGTKTRPYFEQIGTTGQADTIGPVAVTIDNVQAQYTVIVQKLSSRLFQVESEGEVLSGGRYAGSKRRLAQLMRINYTYVPKDRAYTTQGLVRIRGQSSINGVDTVPWGFDCQDMGSQTAVVTKDETLIDVPPGGGNPALLGTPAKMEDPTLDYDDFAEFGDMHVDELKLYADKKLPAPATYTSILPTVTADGLCDKGNLQNWGDPRNINHPCHFYWPIIYAPGDLHLSGGYGQGILIVEGELELSGNFEFAGIVFIYKNIKATGSGNKIFGTVNILGREASDLGMTGAGNTQIKLSSCAIERAHRYADRFARPIPLAERKFVDLSGLGAN